MAELESLPPPLRERLTHLGRADVVVAVPGIATHDALLDTISRVRGVLNGADPAPRTVLIHPDGAQPDPGPANGQPALLPFPLTAVNRLPGPGENLMEVYRTIFLARRAPVWFASDAACAGFKIGQAELGVPVPVQRDPPDANAAVAQLLGPVFQDVERYAACWQKVRGSQAVPTFGPAGAVPDEAGAVEVSRMIDAFRLGYRNLPAVWSVVLPPATLVELKRLTQAAPEAFRLSDELWARIIYDFALAFRLRVMSRDHLLGAMTPLYRAWVASYATEVRTAAPAAIEQRLERLGAAFEAQKPYFVSRWRWPDRFNP